MDCHLILKTIYMAVAVGVHGLPFHLIHKTSNMAVAVGVHGLPFDT